MIASMFSPGWPILARNLSCFCQMDIYPRNQPEPSVEPRCARNLDLKFGPKSNLAAQTSSVVNLYVTNINHFLVKFKKMRVVLKQ